MCYLHSAELFGEGHAHFRANFLFAKLRQMKNLLFRTLHVASVDPPDKKLSKEFW